MTFYEILFNTKLSSLCYLAIIFYSTSLQPGCASVIWLHRIPVNWQQFDVFHSFIQFSHNPSLPLSNCAFCPPSVFLFQLSNPPPSPSASPGIISSAGKAEVHQQDPQRHSSVRKTTRGSQSKFVYSNITFTPQSAPLKALVFFLFLKTQVILYISASEQSNRAHWVWFVL